MKKLFLPLILALLQLGAANTVSAQDFPFEEGVKVRDAITVPESLTGKGVLVGVLDGSFAYSHINFFDPKTNQTRIRAAFPLGIGGHKKVDNPEEIMQINPDSKGRHGTHTAGIAAGSYAAEGWQGVAPEADLCLVDISSGGSERAQLSGLKSVFAVADSLGLPLVVNMSVGEGAPHHGYTDMNLLCEELTDNGNRPGRIIVVSSGNKGSGLSYQECQLGADGKARLPLYAFEGTNLMCQFVTSKEDDPLTVRFFFYDKAAKTEVTDGGITDMDGNPVGIDELNEYMTSYVKDNCPYRFYELIYPEDLFYSNQDIMPGIELSGAEGTKLSYIYHLETEEEDDYFTATQKVYGYNNTLSSTPAVISVGRLDTHGAVTVGLTSSYGRNKYGDKIPDVLAPGTGIISSGERSETQCNTSRDITMPDGSTKTFSWMTFSGTSQATPVVTGLIALMLQHDPTLTANRVRELLHSTNDWTEACDNAPLGPDQAGHGILNTKALFEALMGPSAIESVSSGAADNALYDLFGRRLSDAPQKGIFIRNNKKIAR